MKKKQQKRNLVGLELDGIGPENPFLTAEARAAA
jgi:hypothetical protein